MPIDTDLNQSPFFDDFDESKNYHRILFRPAVPVQARELTQLQTILQNQIERFGDHVFIEGTIIKGCTFFNDREYYYAKLLDKTVEGLDVNLGEYTNTYAVDTSTGLKALVIDTVDGLQSSNTGDFNTIYFKYLNTGSSGETKFANNSTLTIYDRDYSIKDVVVTNGGTGYVNGDVVSFTSNVGGIDAAAYVITHSGNTTIKEIVITNEGTGYTVAPTANVTANSTGGATSGAGATFTVRNYIDQVRIPANTYSAGVGVPVGKGYAFKIADGIIYQKGAFIRVDEQSVIISKYDLSPNNVVVGFRTIETVANNSIDTSLNDNAAGFTNENAPGAYRLKLTPELVTMTKEEAAANTEFFTLVEFENGQVVRQRQTAEYNELGNEFARRTYEESGNYVVRNFSLHTEEKSGDASKLNAVVGSGLGYVNGYRVELLNPIRVPFNKATTSATVEDVTVSTNYGAYVNVNQYKGVFDLTAPLQVSLRDAAGTDVTDNISGIPTNPGSEIGTAYVKSIEYASGTVGTADASYRLYLFNIKMNAGKSFNSVRSITVNGIAIADAVLENSIAVLKDAKYNTSVFATGILATKTAADESVELRTDINNATFNTGGSVTIDVGTINTSYVLPYAANTTLNSVQEFDFIIVPTQQGQTANKTGTVNVTSGANTVAGTGTSFLTEYRVGDYIKVGSLTNQISGITNATSLSVTTNWASSLAANVHCRFFPNNTPVALSSNTASIKVDAVDTSQVVVNLGETLAASMTSTVSCTVRASDFRRNKTLTNNAYVRIANTSLAASPNGPWNIGLPDVHKLVAVYKTTNNSVYTTGTNVTSHFVLDKGQRDSHYGLASIKKSPTSTLTIDGSTNLVVVVDVFRHSASGAYFTVDSYPTSNSTPIEAGKISWADLPSYTSTTGTKYDLRDCVDARIVVSNTVVVTSNASLANVASQSVVESFGTSATFVAPNGIYTANIDKYLPRSDLVVIDRWGGVEVVSGLPSTNPAPPMSPIGTIVIGEITVPPFPTISSSNTSYRTSVYKTSVTTAQNKRYTMKDIEQLDKKITQLQYYSLLSTLESDTRNTNLPSEANTALQRFKNGFIVEPFYDYNVADIGNSEYKAAINTTKKEATPRFRQTKFELNVDTLTNATQTGDAVTLDYTPKVVFNQPYATDYRNPVQALWSFQGAMYMSPSYDNYVSTTQTPATLDFTTMQTQMLNLMEDAFEMIHLNETKSDSTVSTWANGSAWWTGSNLAQRMAANVATTSAWNFVDINPSKANTVTANVGNFVTSVSMQPYMRGRSIAVLVSGLRKGARHYAFFDTKDVSVHMRPAKLADTYNGSNFSIDQLVATGPKGSPLYADANTGVVTAIFYLPDNMFLTGERELIIADVDSYSSLETATSRASAKYSAYNLNTGATALSTASLDMTGVTVGLSSATDTTYKTVEWTRYWDPLAQSFLLSKEHARGGEGLYLTGVDLFFRKKDPVEGVVIELRTVELGVPTTTKLASKRILSSQVQVSNNASVATNVTFNKPVFLTAGYEYAFVIIPESNSPEYLVWTAKAGRNDVLNPQIIKNQDWNQGAMFISTNGSTWTAFQSEDIKFTPYFADFTSLNGTATLVNDDREFLSLEDVNGSFILGEDVAVKGNTYITRSFTTSNTSNIIVASNTIASQISSGDSLLLIYDSGSTTTPTGQTVATSNSATLTGTGTTFTSYLTVGDYLVVGNNSTSTIRKVSSVANNTSLTLDAPISNTVTGLGFHKVVPDYAVVRATSVGTANVVVNKYPPFTSNSTNLVFAEKVVRGVVDYINVRGDEIHLEKSNAANNTFKFAAGQTVIGDVSNAYATIVSVDDKGISYFQPLLTTYVRPGTSLSATSKTLNSANVLVTNTCTIDTTTYLPYQGKVRSRSNEIEFGAGDKSFELTLALTSSANSISPYIDVSPASMLTYKYLINNDATDETGSYGNAVAKYLTKKVVLADGQEAEDLKVYVSAYKPSGTDINVYARVQNETDTEVFDNKDWTLLDLVSANTKSSSGDRQDYIEYEYTFSSEPPANTINYRVTTNSNTVITTPVDFRSASSPTVSANDVLVFENAVTGLYEIRTVASINATAIVVSANLGFSNTGVVVKKVNQINGAFKNYENGAEGVVRYFNDTLGAFDGYKSVAIKVVMTSNSYAQVPKIESVRAIACST